MQPAITIHFDASTQQMRVEANPSVVKNADFALALIEMARRSVEDARRAQIMQQMQMQVAEAQQEAAVRRSLKV